MAINKYIISLRLLMWIVVLCPFFGELATSLLVNLLVITSGEKKPSTRACHKYSTVL
jgi:hypothetical protein